MLFICRRQWADIVTRVVGVVYKARCVCTDGHWASPAVPHRSTDASAMYSLPRHITTVRALMTSLISSIACGSLRSQTARAVIMALRILSRSERTFKPSASQIAGIAA